MGTHKEIKETEIDVLCSSMMTAVRPTQCASN